MNRLLLVICFSNFLAATGTRLTDPIVPLIADGMQVDVAAAALLATAYALPWVVAQPVFGPLGDLIGKTRVIRFNLVMLAASTFVGAAATSFSLLFASRIVAGIATAGVMPVGLALTGDLSSQSDRGHAIARIVAISMAGQLLGMAAAGFLGDLVGWRGVFVAAGIGVLLATAATFASFRGVAESRAASVDLATVIANYRAVFANPRAKVCYGAVFVEGIAIFGVLPYIAPLLLTIGEERAAVAGLIVAGLPLGGVVYSLVIRSVSRRLDSFRRMVLGGVIAAVGLTVVGLTPPWPVQVVALTTLGFGFFMLHNCIQVQMLELAPHARGSAVAAHAASFFSGQALGPVLVALALAAFGPFATGVTAGALMIAVGLVAGRLLYGRGPEI